MARSIPRTGHRFRHLYEGWPLTLVLAMLLLVPSAAWLALLVRSLAMPAHAPMLAATWAQLLIAGYGLACLWWLALHRDGLARRGIPQALRAGVVLGIVAATGQLADGLSSVAHPMRVLLSLCGGLPLLAVLLLVPAMAAADVPRGRRRP